MDGIRRYIDKEDFYLFYGVIFCIAIIIFLQFIASDWREIITHGQKISDVIVNLSLSYLAGWIIYMLSTFIPKINARKKRRETLKPLLKKIVSDFEFNIVNSLLIPNQYDNEFLFEKYNNKPLTIDEDDFNELNKYTNVKLFSVSLYFPNMKIQPNTYREQFVCICLNSRQNNILMLERINLLLDEEALQLINEVESSAFIKRSINEYECFSDFCYDERSVFEHYKAVVALDLYIENKL